MALINKLKSIADNVRAAHGTTELLTLDEIIEKGAGLEVPPESYILVDEEGNEYAAVMVDEEVKLTATENDVREGVTFASDAGVGTGAKYIPSYQTAQGVRVIPSGQKITVANLVKNNNYDYTKFQSIICLYNTSLSNSVSAEIVSIENDLYNVQSVSSIATIYKDHNNKTIDLGITNPFDKPCIVRYFTYKEVE